MKVEDADALIVVDVQNDFCPGGALPVERGDQTPRILNRAIIHFDLLVFSRDWHPSDHCSFSDAPEFKDGSWPPHCVQHSPGAEFHGDLRVPLDAKIVDKGTNPEKEAYSAFDGTDLEEYLRAHQARRVFVGGLATDYCVRATALDAVANGYETYLLVDGCRGVAEDTAQKALDEMQEKGVLTCRVDDIE